MSAEIYFYAASPSSASSRVRIALNMKGLVFQECPISLVDMQHLGEPYIGMNQQGLVPTLVVNGFVLSQSSAIIEFLDEEFPEVMLLPSTSQDRARARAISLLFGADTHPLLTRRVIGLLNEIGVSNSGVSSWRKHWLANSYQAAEAVLAARSTQSIFCLGSTPTIADIYLFSQTLAAKRMGFDVDSYPLISSVFLACSQLVEFNTEFNPQELLSFQRPSG